MRNLWLKITVYGSIPQEGGGALRKISGNVQNAPKLLAKIWKKMGQNILSKTLFVLYLNQMFSDYPQMFCNRLLWSPKALNQFGVENSAHESPLISDSKPDAERKWEKCNVK